MNSSLFAKLKEHETEIRLSFGVKKIGIFGSFARGEEKPDSDIDIFVEFMPGKKTFDNYMGLKNFLESFFERKVDLVTYEGLNPHIRDNVMSGVVYVT
ncbi:nucleotidyltransferase family protein [Methanolacinia paynteri]|uniref:nucleotidyltransferase family protein n=1 Tax=Methanolacinia paynteri TaxID=230356 RepID=UPI00064F9582|nr:nucleotidyltransferase family protein [Methanolacinia paynteri]